MRQQGGIYRWLAEHFAAVASARRSSIRMDWREIAARAGKDGARTGTGDWPTAEQMRAVFHRVAAAYGEPTGAPQGPPVAKRVKRAKPPPTQEP
jgi:hypothetical protein